MGRALLPVALPILDSNFRLLRGKVMNRVIVTSAAGFLLLAGVARALPKDPAAHVSHLQAGTVRYVKGKQLLLAGGQGVPAEIAIGHRLEPGDIVRTGRGDRLEIMLHPGGYLRLGDHAQLEVLDTVYRKMHFRVSEGTLVVDSTRFKGPAPRLQAVDTSRRPAASQRRILSNSSPGTVFVGSCRSLRQVELAEA